MIRIALFTTLFVLSAHIAGSGIASVSAEKLSEAAEQLSEPIKEQNVSGIASGDWVEACYLKDVFCPNKRLMRITEYGWTGNKMASGKYPYIGAVATSDRSIPLGAKVVVDGKEYTVEDRTAKWVHEMGDTIDIYSENPKGLSYNTVYFE